MIGSSLTALYLDHSVLCQCRRSAVDHFHPQSYPKTSCLRIKMFDTISSTYATCCRTMKPCGRPEMPSSLVSLKMTNAFPKPSRTLLATRVPSSRLYSVFQGSHGSKPSFEPYSRECLYCMGETNLLHCFYAQAYARHCGLRFQWNFHNVHTYSRY